MKRRGEGMGRIEDWQKQAHRVPEKIEDDFAIGNMCGLSRNLANHGLSVAVIGCDDG